MKKTVVTAVIASTHMEPKYLNIIFLEIIYFYEIPHKKGLCWLWITPCSNVRCHCQNHRKTVFATFARNGETFIVLIPLAPIYPVRLDSIRQVSAVHTGRPVKQSNCFRSK